MLMIADESQRLHREVMFPGVVGDLLETAAVSAARAIDEDVDAAQFLYRGCDRRLDGHRTALQIERHYAYAQIRVLFAQLRGERFAARRIAAEQGEIDALGGERE